MDAFHLIADAKIREALERGELKTSLAGRPLDLNADARVPAELRMPYRLLKNAGYVPEELEVRRETLRLEDLLRACEDPEERRELGRRLSLRTVQLELLARRRGAGGAWNEYRPQLSARLGGR